jgi:hypothetical protein
VLAETPLTIAPDRVPLPLRDIAAKVRDGIHLDAAGTSQQLTRAELERIVRETGFTPVERDTLYNPVRPPENIASPPVVDTAAALAH